MLTRKFHNEITMMSLMTSQNMNGELYLGLVVAISFMINSQQIKSLWSLINIHPIELILYVHDLPHPSSRPDRQGVLGWIEMVESEMK